MSRLEHPIHAALIRSPLLASAEPGFVVLEVTVVLALLTVVGLSIPTVALALSWGLGVHAIAVRLAARDPLLSRLYLRSLALPAYAFPTPRLVGARRVVARAAIPGA